MGTQLVTNPTLDMRRVPCVEDIPGWASVGCSEYTTHIEWLTALRAANRANTRLIFGPGWDYADDGSPLPPRIRMRHADALVLGSLAAVMHHHGLFKSTGEAKRNGWNRPAAPGVYPVGKRVVEIES